MSNVLYVQALQALQFALENSTRRHLDELVATSLFLSLHESSILNPDWVRHAQGAASLIQSTRLPSSNSEPAYHIFVASRVPILYTGISTRKAIFLMNVEWRNLLPSHTHLDRLIKVVANIPAILERIDSVADGDQRRNLKALSQLQKMMDEWEYEIVDKPQILRNIMSDNDDESPFKTQLWFNDNEMANAYSVYHLCSLVVAETAATLGASPSNDVKSATYHAVRIASMIPYCLRPDMGALGACIINFPGSHVLDYFARVKNRPAELWLTRVFEARRDRVRSGHAPIEIEPHYVFTQENPSQYYSQHKQSIDVLE